MNLPGILLLFLPIILNLPVVQMFSCQTPSGSEGSCVSLRACPNLLRLLRRPISLQARALLRSSVCRYGQRLPYVCCPILRSTTTTTTTTPKPAPLISLQCGKQGTGNKRPAGTRVVGGTAAKPGEWPWLAALGYRSKQGGQVRFLCGGALIGPSHVITAAHCIRSDLTTILLGEHILGIDTDGANPQEVGVASATRHPAYSSRTYSNDIGVIKLSKPVVFNQGIQPICLPSLAPSLVNATSVGHAMFIAGWGAVRFNGPTSNTLLEGLVTVISEEECKSKLARFRNIKIGATKLCARDLADKVDACQGDSGGPLMTKRIASDGSERWFLVGVVSFGYKCAVPGFPGVYTRVTEYEEWVRRTVTTN